MISTGWEFLNAIKFVTNEQFDQEAVAGIESIVKDWRQQIEATSHPTEKKIEGAIYQGALLGLQIGARARMQAAKRVAQDRGIKLEDE